MSKKFDDTIEISDDDETTYYGSDFSISEDSDNESIQFICEIIKPKNSTSRNTQASRNICRAIILELLQKLIE